MGTESPTPTTASPTRPRKRGRGLRPWFLMPKLAGLLLFLGGVSTMTMVGLLAPEPDTLDGWQALRGMVRVVVLACMLPGVSVVIICGVLLLLQHPKVFWRTRWFKLKLALILVFTPAIHLWARGQTKSFDDALASGDLATVSTQWGRMTMAFGAALVFYMGLALIGRLKPRLGEKLGSRSK